METRQFRTAPQTRTRAFAKVTVQSSEAYPYDQTASSALVEIHLSEIFAGDIDGISTVRALEVRCEDQSASLTSLQRFSRKLNGRGAASYQTGETSRDLIERADECLYLAKSIGRNRTCSERDLARA